MLERDGEDASSWERLLQVDVDSMKVLPCESDLKKFQVHLDDEKEEMNRIDGLTGTEGIDKYQKQPEDIEDMRHTLMKEIRAEKGRNRRNAEVGR